MVYNDSFFVDLAYLKEAIENIFLVVSFTHKTPSFSTKRKEAKHNLTHDIKEKILS